MFRLGLHRDLEFRTTGLPYPSGVVVTKGESFGRPLYELLDADQTVIKSCRGFLLIPWAYQGVGIQLQGRRLLLQERFTQYEQNGCPERDPVLQVGEGFP